MRFVQRAQTLGFSLAEIRELLELRLSPGGSAEDVRRRAEAMLADTRSRICDLERVSEALEQLVQACGCRGSSDEYPILGALDGPTNE